jgi:putative ABC transport system permease protein
MQWLSEIMGRVRQWTRGRGTTEAAMDAEMRYHIDCEIAERMRQGATLEEARRSALRDFGGIERHKEEARDGHLFRLIDDAARDVRFATRVLGRNPGFTSAVVLTFALGIGCTCAIFALVNAILLRPLPYPRPNELVALWERNAARGVERNVVSVKTVEAWQEHARSFSAVAAMVPSHLTLGGTPPERIAGAQVSASYFRLLGVRPALGRDFADADEANGGASVVIFSDALWRSRYGAEASVIGRAIVIDGQPFTVIGVMPPDFDPPRYGWMTEHPLWVPFGATPGNRGWGRFLHVIARRRTGVSIEQARAEVTALAERMSREVEGNKEWSATVVPLEEQITGDVRTPLLVLFAAVGLLLLLSIVNVANLVTAFARRRQHELALRRAIGATPFRLLRQQLAQSALLGAIGAVVGLGIAFIATRGLVALMPAQVPRLVGVDVNGTVLSFALLAAAATTLIAGTAAALKGLPRGEETLDLTTTHRTTSRLGGAKLVTAEIAIGLVLSVLAALMVRSFANLRSIDLGFRPTAVITGRVTLPSSNYGTEQQQRAFFDELRARAQALPGVKSVSVATTPPFKCCAPSTSVTDGVRLGVGPAAAPTTDVRFVDESYFAALRIPVIAGAVFTRTEPLDGMPNAVVSRSLARTLWGGQNPIGRTVAISLFGTTTARVIGVVADVYLVDPRTQPRPAAFLSTTRFPSNERDLIVRGSGDVNALVTALRGAIAAVDASVPLYRVASLESSVGETLARDRFITVLLSAFAALSLLLAAVGVYGVVSTDVTHRRKEIGIRVALGAATSAVASLVLRRVLGPALGGVSIGVAAALLLARSMSAMVFGVGTADPSSFAVVIGLLLLVAGIATLVPALRATRVSPLEAIR